MAKSKPKETKETKEDDNAPVKAPGRLKKIIGKASSIIAILALITMFAGIYSLKVVDLREALFPVGPYALYAFIIFAIVGEVLRPSGAQAGPSALPEDFDISKVNEQLLKLESRFGARFFSEYETLKADNAKMRGDLDAAVEQQQEKQVNELQELRKRNAELEAMIKQIERSDAGIVAQDSGVMAAPDPDEAAQDTGVMSAVESEQNESSKAA